MKIKLLAIYNLIYGILFAMGNFTSKIWKQLFGDNEYRMVMIGLDGAGKTTILYQFKLGTVTHTVPTIGFNVETVSYKKLSFTVFDIGGQDKIRPLWKYYYINNNGIIFVVDSTDVERLDDEKEFKNSAKEELYKILDDDDLRGLPLLVFANKQDLPGALRVDEVANRLGLPKVTNRKWFVQGTNAITKHGLYEGLDWMAEAVKKK